MAKAKKAKKKRADKYEPPIVVTATFAEVFSVVKQNKEQKKTSSK